MQMVTAVNHQTVRNPALPKPQQKAPRKKLIKQQALLLTLLQRLKAKKAARLQPDCFPGNDHASFSVGLSLSISANDQHSVTIAVETIAELNCRVISTKNAQSPCQCSNEKKK